MPFHIFLWNNSYPGLSHPLTDKPQHSDSLCSLRASTWVAREQHNHQIQSRIGSTRSWGNTKLWVKIKSPVLSVQKRSEKIPRRGASGNFPLALRLWSSPFSTSTVWKEWSPTLREYTGDVTYKRKKSKS